jgi:ABC-type nickel/cobalt efflux system permease component RcnA
MKLGYKFAWLLLLLVVAVSFAFIFIPAYLIQPFAPQTERSVAISYFLKSWSPIVTLLIAIGVIGLTFAAWKSSKRWYSKVPLVLPIFLALLFAWFARQNHFEWMFNPLKSSDFAKAADVDFVKDDEMVLAVKINGDAVAYPVSLMAYHHVAQDVVGGTPITATY